MSLLLYPPNSGNALIYFEGNYMYYCCFRGQFSHVGASKKQINQDASIERSTTKAQKNARKPNSGEALNASGGWLNPKTSASSTKKTGTKQVQASGQASGRWYTSPDGRKVGSDPISIFNDLFFRFQSCP